MGLTIVNAGQNYWLRGGSDRYMIELGHLLEARGHRVIPFAGANPHNDPTPWARFFPRAANFDRPGTLDLVRFVYSAPAARALRALLREVAVDLAHLHIYYGKLTAAILRPLRRAGIPVVQTLHEYKLICPVYTLVSQGAICEACRGHQYWRALPRRCNRGSLPRTALSVLESYFSRAAGSWRHIDHFIGVSRFIRDKMIQYGVPETKITTVHNFVDAARYTPSTAVGKHFLYFGRLENVKGLFTLLQAAERLKEVPLLLAGDGEARAALQARIHERSLSHVKLLGFRRGKDLQDLIRQSICTLLPSQWYENCPMSVLESLAHARPVIASRIGGIPELIVDGEDGFLTPPGDVEALADRMRWMADHRREAIDLGVAGRRKVEAQFNAEVHYAQLLDVYHKVL